MSAGIPVYLFTSIALLYLLLSLVAYLLVGFTMSAWLVYGAILLPIKTIAILWTLVLAVRHRKQKLRYRRPFFYPILILQVLVFLASPVSCIGWKQGNSCYPLLQVYTSKVTNFPPAWGIVDIFPLLVMAYGISLLLFLARVRVETRSPIYRDLSDLNNLQ
jgi:hypothetical protein